MTWLQVIIYAYVMGAIGCGFLGSIRREYRPKTGARMMLCAPVWLITAVVVTVVWVPRHIRQLIREARGEQ